MKAGNWEKLEDIFHAAIILPFGERQPFLARECGSDRELLSEVELLIENFEGKPEFLDTPVFELGLGAIHGATVKNLAGTTIGAYEIKEKIGAGGMGEVYKAFDTMLNRTVALKFLPESLKNDAAAQRRLAREARAAAALEHPNICTVYGFEQTDDHHFIVMQCVEGKTLGERFEEKTAGVEEFKSLARQIFTAVAFAHEHGVVHRDLKPGNIMVTDDGQIKILDFGLAKIDPAKQLTNGNGSEELSRFSTNGLIIGTIAYMSPEQLRGEKLDYSSDIFSVGVILYKLIAGKNPFNRPSQAETIAAILSENPALLSSLRELSPAFPESYLKIIEKCLQREKSARFESAAKVLVEFDNAETEKTNPTALSRTTKFIIKTAVAAVLLALIVIGFLSSDRQQRTLAVLPVVLEDLPVEKEYLADGLTASIIEKLSGLSGLSVKNENSVTPFKGKIIQPQDAGKQLGADAVLAAKIINRANETLLVINLVRVSDGLVLDKNYELKVEDTNLTRLQEEVAARVLLKINANLSDADRNKLAKKDTTNEEAKRSYFLGRYYLSRRQREDLQNAEKFFREATDLDPYYAKAWAGLADTYTTYSLPGFKGSMAPDKAVMSARAAAKHAMDIDSNLSEPYNSLGMIMLRYEWNWKAAESYFQDSINRKPDFFQAHLGLSQVMIINGQFDAAVAQAQRVKEISPFAVSSDLNLIGAYFFKRDYEQMSKALAESMEKFSNHLRLEYFRGILLIETERINEAGEVFEKMYQQDKKLAAAPLGYVYGKLGRRDDALRVLAEYEELSKKEGEGFVPAQEKALIFLGLGDKEKVFENLNKACQERLPSFPFIAVDPIFDEVRSDSRFDDVKKCANL